MSPLSLRLELIRNVLGDNYLPVIIEHLEFSDDMEGNCSATVTLDSGAEATGDGTGQIDAVFAALKNYFSTEYESLESIELHDFEVKLNSKTRRRADGADAICNVRLEVKNSEGRIFEFKSGSRSLSSSSAAAIAQAVGLFVNSERAFMTLYKALTDAKARGREDLVTRFISELSEVVKSTSYAAVIERVKQEVKL